MGGGKATNAGVDYQQRVAAWFLINQYIGINISDYFDQIDDELIINKVHFETDDPIDDLKLSCCGNQTVFLQIKRSISLSEKDTSEFHKTVTQFVKEYITSKGSPNYLGLITTSDASSKITVDLKKIVASIRLNIVAFDENPLNNSEKETLKKFGNIFKSIYKSLSGNEPSETEFRSFASKVFIGIIDIESGFSIEMASLMLLRSVGFKKPELMWSVMIKNSLVYASGRHSIENQKLTEIFGKYIGDFEKNAPKEQIDDLMMTETIMEGYYSVGKEVVIIESFVEDHDYLIVELHRFKDDCQIKNKFSNDKLILENGEEWTVVQRFSSMTGMNRFVEENVGMFEEKSVVIIPANEIDNVDETECSELHKTLIDSLLKQNSNVLKCLHCEKMVEEGALIVEIDDLDSTRAVGTVHNECLRPIDRIMGVIKTPGREKDVYLNRFDFKLWVSLMMKGQGLLSSLRATPQIGSGQNAIISWNPDEEYDVDYSYCIQFVLEDDSTSYAYNRSRIHRVNKSHALDYVALFQNTQKTAKEMNDPWCMLTISKTSGNYSHLLKIKKEGEEVLEIVEAKVVRYSKQIAKVFDKEIFHYAPLCFVRHSEEETILNLNNVVPIISDPLRIGEFYGNWKKLGFEVEMSELKIIKSDKDFDSYMRMFFEHEMTPIVDPVFDLNFNLISGFEVVDYNEMIKEGEKGG